VLFSSPPTLCAARGPRQLGVLLCELLTGVHPFMDKDGQVYVDAIEKRPPKLVVGQRDVSAADGHRRGGGLFTELG